MFGRQGREDENQETTTTQDSTSAGARPAEASMPRATAPTIAPRRVADIPNARRMSSNTDAEKKLIVGRGLSLAGEITSCDVLVVEGKVEAKLTEGKLLEITEAGQFRGSVEIENADIAGRYDGQLVVHGRLTVRSTGRISGMVKYGELEINAGGQIIGEMQVVGGGAQAAATGGANFKSAAKFTALTDEEEKESASSASERKSERKSA